MKSKKELSVLLSKLKGFENPKVNLEQYITDSEIAGDALWIIDMEEKLRGKSVVDLGCGPGVLGLGASVLGAEKVCLVDIDKNSILVARENKKFLENILKKKLNADIINQDVRKFNKKTDIIIQNPPFGVQKSHTDKVFLMKAMELSDLIYSFHKEEGFNFIRKFCKDNDFSTKKRATFKFPLKQSLRFHRKKTHIVYVDFWRIERLKKENFSH